MNSLAQLLKANVNGVNEGKGVFLFYFIIQKCLLTFIFLFFFVGTNSLAQLLEVNGIKEDREVVFFIII
ncbi:hypothetical protein C1645_789878 [Glomus cerebriforme]|uniref:Uncharacterized protein n=1 Tax=Glomus cerebriforme TaxID=658196 RepID=A0A397S879_9GLOM|nr:hypothetical protein C1645_789878 [Glomus cerebriforme]